MKRYVISPIVGDGSMDNPYRAKVQDMVTNCTAEIPTGDDGRPTSDWCLALVAAPNLGAIIADPEIDLLPDFSKDAKISSMHGPTKTAMLNALQRRGFPKAQFDGVDGFREVLRTVGRRLNPNFHEDSFDVSDS